MPKWRADSVFGPGPRVPLDRERRAVFRARLTMRAYRCPGRLTITAAAVGRILVDMLGANGRLDPSVATLARLAAVDESTVTRALARLRDCGFVTWTRRLVRDAGTAWRCAQASNAYALLVPTACDARFATPVSTRVSKQEASARTSRAGLSDRDARENAAQQLDALGFPELAAQQRATR